MEENKNNNNSNKNDNATDDIIIERFGFYLKALKKKRFVSDVWK